VAGDPLYRFTASDFEDLISYHFDRLLSPFLSYVRDKYGRPVRPDGYLIDPFYETTNLECPAKLNAGNFKYGLPRQIAIDQMTFWKPLLTKFPKKEWAKGVEFGKVSLAVLTVQVPNDLRHPFWAKVTTSYEWDLKGLGTEFVVEKYADDREEAFRFATQHAIKLIQSIRSRTDPGPSTNLLHPAPRNCAALKLGRELHDMWIGAADDAFLTSSHEFWAEACDKLGSFIQEFPQFRFLLEYYKVLFPC